jgi:hypothetical protein
MLKWNSSLSSRVREPIEEVGDDNELMEASLIGNDSSINDRNTSLSNEMSSSCEVTRREVRRTGEGLEEEEEEEGRVMEST